MAAIFTFLPSSIERLAKPGRPSMLRTLSLCTCCCHYPGAATGGYCFAHPPSHISLPRKGSRVGLRIDLFEACSAFTRVTACTLALSPICDSLSEGFSHFVTSMTAPVASGWSICRAGFTPTGKRRLITAHTPTGHTRRREAAVASAPPMPAQREVGTSAMHTGCSPAHCESDDLLPHVQAVAG